MSEFLEWKWIESGQPSTETQALRGIELETGTGDLRLEIKTVETRIGNRDDGGVQGEVEEQGTREPGPGVKNDRVVKSSLYNQEPRQEKRGSKVSMEIAITEWKQGKINQGRS
ncbi:hypothetical protein K435DRAFT_841798 [Dendrothele bispora CBS 962.96]|uniref:Uncharacterized protein n=1 Tax=Dendrothele bispora (strain CBS 962.96) TaxID=1314807 RepID=A0A4S8LK41_DENBC|nr:hypothetical protein K435DRAFT_845798 [Dendrothele bispora CBS 962.96]THU89484.1 hypothetical protein K435DRAFT_841798 [Dendrothele bispora CBS 962.96]